MSSLYQASIDFRSASESDGSRSNGEMLLDIKLSFRSAEESYCEDYADSLIFETKSGPNLSLDGDKLVGGVTSPG